MSFIQSDKLIGHDPLHLPERRPHETAKPRRPSMSLNSCPINGLLPYERGGVHVPMKVAPYRLGSARVFESERRFIEAYQQTSSCLRNSSFMHAVRIKSTICERDRERAYALNSRRQPRRS